MVAKQFHAVGSWLSLAVGLSGSAYADCGSDMQKLAEARNTQLEIVNNFAKSFHGKPLDPEAFCGKSGGLVRAENALIAYMEKNKDWCSFPDEAIAQLKEHHAKNTAFSAKACTVAAQMKKMKEQAAQGGGTRRAGADAAVPTRKLNGRILEFGQGRVALRAHRNVWHGTLRSCPRGALRNAAAAS